MGGTRHVIDSIEVEFRRCRSLGERVIGQLEAEELAVRPSTESNSISMLVWHVAGNLKSRFTDFLTSDGEKPWRNRETEFDERRVSRVELLAKWEDGWDALFEALAPLSDQALDVSVSIRGLPLSVGEALHRSLAHVSYHVGQMTFLGKMLRGERWQYLSIPPGESDAYDLNPTLEKGPA